MRPDVHEPRQDAARERALLVVQAVQGGVRARDSRLRTPPMSS
jgi:hypothetical protein